MSGSMAAAPHELLTAVESRSPVSGSTHNFYKYPAAFSPEFARAAIRQYSSPGDVVLDPFMGGGTSVVEAVTLGRRAVGVDLNTLAAFVTRVKTTPLSKADEMAVLDWCSNLDTNDCTQSAYTAQAVRNLPAHLQETWAALKSQVALLPTANQRAFARCAILRTAQFSVDCRPTIPAASESISQLAANVVTMMNGMRDFVATCRSHGLVKADIRRNRAILCRSSIGLEADSRMHKMPKARLVVTSPPYPAVHILYHRWQVLGRRETPAPYWLTSLRDGHYGSHYTFGSRSELGLTNYFNNVRDCFTSIRGVVEPDALVIQLVAFSDARSQLGRYLKAMEHAGFEEVDQLQPADGRIWRTVPNRKWYCNNGREQDSTKEVVLFHQPSNRAAQRERRPAAPCEAFGL